MSVGNSASLLQKNIIIVAESAEARQRTTLKGRRFIETVTLLIDAALNRLGSIYLRTISPIVDLDLEPRARRQKLYCHSDHYFYDHLGL